MADLLSGKVAVITGGGRGIGRHVAEGLARRGVRVGLAARSRDQLTETADSINRAGGVALAMPIDVASPPDVARLHERVLAELGPTSILINAAGTFGPIQPIHESDVDRWLETIRTNTIGPFLTCRAFLNDMLSDGWGRIINFSSAAALHPPGTLNSAYGTSKVALNQFTRHLAAELVGTGVTANVIHPGEVKTDMWAAIRQEAASAENAERFREWAADVGEHGGDDPQKALDLIFDLLEGRLAHVSGKFLWIEGGLQQPIASW
jgi:NAD(P)-dependent dehydrogenase (short-subunit alcohol dehydrogenase family)